MNISFTKNKEVKLLPIKAIGYGSVFIDLNDRKVYIKINELDQAVSLVDGRVVDFGENYKVRVLEDDEYKFEVFV